MIGERWGLLNCTMERGQDRCPLPNSGDPGGLLAASGAVVLMPRTLPTFVAGGNIGNLNSGQTVKVPILPGMGIRLLTPVANVGSDPDRFAGLQIGCLREKCHDR